MAEYWAPHNRVSDGARAPAPPPSIVSPPSTVETFLREAFGRGWPPKQPDPEGQRDGQVSAAACLGPTTNQLLLCPGMHDSTRQASSAPLSQAPPSRDSQSQSLQDDAQPAQALALPGTRAAREVVHAVLL